MNEELRPWMGAAMRRYLQSRGDESWRYTACAMRWYFMFGIDVVGCIGDRVPPDSTHFYHG